MQVMGDQDLVLRPKAEIGNPPFKENATQSMGIPGSHIGPRFMVGTSKKSVPEMTIDMRNSRGKIPVLNGFRKHFRNRLLGGTNCM